MINLSNYTATELLKEINDLKLIYDKLKSEIVIHTHELDDLEQLINEKIEVINNKLNVLKEIEQNYIILIEELNNR